MKKIFYSILISLSFTMAAGQSPQSIAGMDKTDTVEEKESAEKSIYSIFPNPSSNFIKIRSKGAPPDAVSIHDVAGTKLMEDRDGRALNVYSLPRGIYTVHVRSGNRVEKIRFEKL